MSNEHTPGPWFTVDPETGEKDRNGISIAAGEDPSDGPFIATCEPYSNFEMTRANSRLISAAPDLLEAVEFAYARALQTSDQDSELINKLFAAIIKSTKHEVEP